jgi:hypothetical protein
MVNCIIDQLTIEEGGVLEELPELEKTVMLNRSRPDSFSLLDSTAPQRNRR